MNLIAFGGPVNKKMSLFYIKKNHDPKTSSQTKIQNQNLRLDENQQQEEKVIETLQRLSLKL